MLDLVPMTEAEFAAYLADAVRCYADAHLRAGGFRQSGAGIRRRTLP